MKRQKRMMILLGILAVCTAGTVAVSRIDFEEKMSETETAIIDIDTQILPGWPGIMKKKYPLYDRTANGSTKQMKRWRWIRNCWMRSQRICLRSPLIRWWKKYRLLAFTALATLLTALR